MKIPSVCCVCLTADRQTLTDRAVKSYLAQDYQAKMLLIYDSGAVEYDLSAHDVKGAVILQCYDPPAGLSVGRLRNEANALTERTDILIHFDSDDWSAPTRISDQVKLLVESGKQAVGYREMLFWDCRPSTRDGMDTLDEAWLYRNTDPRYIVSTSACYWRKTWEEKPFDDVPTGEVGRWIKGLETLGEGLGYWPTPEILATIHGGNTVKKHIFPAATNPDGSPMWVRVADYDARCRQIIEAA